MKKYNHLFLIFLLIFTLTACAAKTEAPVAKLAKASLEAADKAPNLYTNDKLSFSFVIPDSWETENYAPVVSDATMQDGTKYTKVDFVFQGDKDNPLLSVMLVPKTSFDKMKKGESSAPASLGTKGDVVYCYTLPASSPYDVGTKSDLYNSMVLLQEDVPKRFTIIGGDSSAEAISSIEGVLQEGTMHTLLIKADDGRTLAFAKDVAEKTNIDEGLVVGCKVKISYRGTIDGTNTGKATIIHVEKIK